MSPIDLENLKLKESATAGGPIRVAFPIHSATGTASTAAVLFELDPGSELATHRDSAEEVLLVLEGSAEARIADRSIAVGPGQLVVVPARVPHSVLNHGNDRLRILGVFAASTVVATFAEPLAPGGPQMMVIGAPIPLAAPLQEPVPA
jgi:mannose-6-phosphate isomerase-like protein (cupin superfamily)